ILVLVVILVVLAAAGYAIGLFNISAERQEGKYLATLEINTAMLHQATESAEARARRLGESLKQETLKGSISALDSGSFTLTLDDRQERTIHLDGDSALTGTQLKGLAVGDRVTV